LTPEEKSDVIEYMEVKQEMARLRAERVLVERYVFAQIAAYERQIEDLENQRLREMFWLPWPMYLR
jgi:hypothetical protein